jgi:hypothetical protein
MQAACCALVSVATCGCQCLICWGWFQAKQCALLLLQSSKAFAIAASLTVHTALLALGKQVTALAAGASLHAHQLVLALEGLLQLHNVPLL